MAGMTSTQMRKQIMQNLIKMTEAEPVMGWNLWLKIAADNDFEPSEIKTGPYKRFKEEMADLKRAGYIGGAGQGRAVARLNWDVTSEGEEWWEEHGQHEVDGAAGGDGERLADFVKSKWLTAGTVPKNRVTWSKIAAAALRGEIQIAIRYTETKK